MFQLHPKELMSTQCVRSAGPASLAVGGVPPPRGRDRSCENAREQRGHEGAKLCSPFSRSLVIQWRFVNRVQKQMNAFLEVSGAVGEGMAWLRAVWGRSPTARQAQAGDPRPKDRDCTAPTAGQPGTGVLSHRVATLPFVACPHLCFYYFSICLRCF